MDSDECLPDSLQGMMTRVGTEDRVYSDGEEYSALDLGDTCWTSSGATAAAGLSQARQSLRPTLTSRGGRARIKPQRRLYSSATAATRPRSEAPKKEEAELTGFSEHGTPSSNPLSLGDGGAVAPLGLQQQPTASNPSRPHSKGSSFVGHAPRVLLPSRRTPPQPDAVAARAPPLDEAPRRRDPVETARTATAGDAAAQQAGPSAPQPRPQEPLQPLRQAPEPLRRQVVNRTDDGLNIVFLRQQNQGGEAKEQVARRSVNTGWGNNFVRIDMKKGRGSTKFVASRRSNKRGRAGRGKWKTTRLRQVGDGADFMEGWQGSQTSCFKCGGKGHWAKDCNADADANMDVGSSDEEPETGPAAGGEQGAVLARALTGAAAPLGSNAEVAAISVAEQPSAEYAAVADEPTPEALATVLHAAFGFPAFRGLQVETIQRVLRGDSCLAIMPTGMGKSLCYQLPALLLPGLTLVVSPLIALMHDQCAAAPQQLRPALLWSGQAPALARQVLADVASGASRLLFVSPERLANPHLLAALRPRMPLALVVVDEAHCVAEWGHSFRPAYFRLGGALQRAVSARAVLALTATATRSTQAAVCSVLGIPPQAVLRDAAVRTNLRLSVARRGSGAGGQRGNWGHVVQLFTRGALADARSAIVYCAWKGDADTIARQLDMAGVCARAYHAGMHYKERATIEQAFARKRLRVVVATVAFGMGIDISSVQAVVHSVMPRSLEEYVQQVGRAGRDGSEARCIAFLDDGDFLALRALAYSGTVELTAVRELLGAIFSTTGAAQGAAVPRASKAGKKRKAAAAEQEQEGEACPVAATGDDGEGAAEDGATAAARYGVLPARKISVEVDMPEDSIEAVLSYLEAHDPRHLRVLPKTAVSAKVSFYAAAPDVLAEEHPVVRAVLASCPQPRNGLYSMPTARLAAAAQKTPGLVLQDLQLMAQQKLIGFELSSEQGPAYELLATPRDLDELAGTVHRRLTDMLTCQVGRLDTSYRAFAGGAAEQQPLAQDAVLRTAIEQYFDGAEPGPAGAPQGGSGQAGPALDLQGLPLRSADAGLLQATRAVLRRNQEQGADETLTPCMLARILHGTGSPALPRDQWTKRMGAFWGSYRSTDFVHVLNAARIACRKDPPPPATLQ